MEIKRMLELIIDAAKNDDMNRIIELAENQQDKFCDNNCVWTDHHKDCVRAEQKPVVEVRLVAGGKPMFLMCVLPESFKDGDSLYTTPQQPIIDKSAAIRIATALGWTPPKQEQVCRDDGRCQYAIDSGAEGMGHCPSGKCVMPAKQEQGEDLAFKADYWKRMHDEVRAELIKTTSSKQEPVGYADAIAFDEAMRFGKGCDVWPVKGDYEQRTGRKLRPLYTTPQQRKPLTDEQIELAENQIWNTDQLDEVDRQANKEFVRAIEAAHGIKE